MTAGEDDLAQFFASITERRRTDVAAAQARIAQVEAGQARVVAEIEQQAHEAVTAVVAAAGNAEDGSQAEATQQDWPWNQDDQEVSAVLNNTQSCETLTNSVWGTSESFDASSE